jgi:hypothetical protein
MHTSIRRTGWALAGALLLAAGTAAPVSAQSSSDSAAGVAGRPRTVIGPRSNFAGIGQGRARTDLLSQPARNRTFTPALPVFTPPGPIVIPRWPVYRHHHHHYPHHFYPFPIYREPVFTSGGGLVVRGSYSDDRLRVGFHLGSTGVYSLPRPAISYSPIDGSYFYGNPLIDPGMQPAFMGPPTTQTTPAPSQSTVSQAPTDPPTALDYAKAAMQAGQPLVGITHLRKHLKEHPDDAAAMRLLSLALLQEKQFDTAVAMLRQAYIADPSLSIEPIAPWQLGLSDQEFHKLVSRAVLFAHRVDSGSAWLMVASLMQAQGRREQALNMLNRAERQGLQTEVLSPLKAALSS